jgi:hypothetical protein
VAHAVARDADVGVGLVFAPRNAVGAQVLEHVGAGGVDERTDDLSDARPDAAEAARTGAAEQPKEKRLRLIVARVADGDAIRVETCRGSLEKRVADGTRRRLDRRSFFPRPRGDVGRFDLDRHAERGGRSAAERLVRLRRASTKPVVEVSQTDECELAGALQLGKDVHERHRVGSA